MGSECSSSEVAVYGNENALELVVLAIKFCEILKTTELHIFKKANFNM